MKSAKIVAMAVVLTFGILSYASAGERQYDSSMPRQAIQQHEQYVKGLERAAALEAKRAKAQVVSSEATDAAAVTGAITAIIIIAALL